MQPSVNGRTLEYDITGNGADVVIFLHALGVNRKMWEPQVPAFACDYTVATYDIRAGQTPPAPSLADFADDLLALADAVGTRQPHLVGISMGGMVAQVFAIRHRDRVKSLVLASTTSSYPEEMRQQVRQRAEVAEREGMGPLVESTLERWFTPEFAAEHPATVAWIRQMLASADPHQYAAAARAVAEVDTSAQLAEIAAPALILRPELDSSMPPDASDVLRSHIRNTRQATIPRTAHLCNIGNPDAFNHEVSGFLNWVVQETPGEEGVPGLPAHGTEPS